MAKSKLMQPIYDILIYQRVFLCLKAVTELKVSENVPERGIDIPQLAKKLNCNSDFLLRVLRFLSCFSIFSINKNKLHHTPTSKVLNPNHPDTFQPYIKLHCSNFFSGAWDVLYQSIRTGRPGFDIAHGKPFFEYMKDHPAESEVFNFAMAANPLQKAHALTSGYNFSKFSTFMDVGGGFGHMLAGVLHKYPTMRGFLFDMEHVIREAKKQTFFSGMESRMQFVSGSFFEKIAPKVDGILMVHIIHDWGHADCIKILQNCQAALNPKGEILIVDRVLPEKPSLQSAAKFSMDVNMLAATSFGRERTRKEFQALAKDAGLRIARILPCGLDWSIVVMK